MNNLVLSRQQLNQPLNQSSKLHFNIDRWQIVHDEDGSDWFEIEVKFHKDDQNTHSVLEGKERTFYIPMSDKEEGLRATAKLALEYIEGFAWQIKDYDVEQTQAHFASATGKVFYVGSNHDYDRDGVAQKAHVEWSRPKRNRCGLESQFGRRWRTTDPGRKGRETKGIQKVTVLDREQLNEIDRLARQWKPQLERRENDNVGVRANAPVNNSIGVGSTANISEERQSIWLADGLGLGVHGGHMPGPDERDREGDSQGGKRPNYQPQHPTYTTTDAAGSDDVTEEEGRLKDNRT